MKVVSLADFDAAVAQAAAAVRAGEAIIYPTDTVYALGVDARSPRALELAYAAKGRSSAKPLSLCVADMTQAGEYVVLDGRAAALADAFLPGPLTLICPSRNALPAILQAGFPGIGVRVPGHPFGPALAKAIGGPITTTSANTSGLAAATDSATAEAAFAAAEEKPTLLIDGGPAQLGTASTIVDLTGETKLLRQGAITFDSVLDVLRRAGFH
jgi:L-threonylcarbamoyladenylate synthase